MILHSVHVIHCGLEISVGIPFFLRAKASICMSHEGIRFRNNRIWSAHSMVGSDVEEQVSLPLPSVCSTSLFLTIPILYCHLPSFYVSVQSTPSIQQ